jgi:hypothetical protein
VGASSTCFKNTSMYIFLSGSILYINWVGGLGTPMNKAYLSISFSFGIIPNGPDFVCKNMKICLNKTSSKDCIGEYLCDMFWFRMTWKKNMPYHQYLSLLWDHWESPRNPNEIMEHVSFWCMLPLIIYHTKLWMP